MPTTSKPNLSILVIKLNEQWDPAPMVLLNYILLWRRIDDKNPSQWNDFTARPLQSIFQLAHIFEKLGIAVNPVELETRLQTKSRYSADVLVDDQKFKEFFKADL